MNPDAGLQAFERRLRQQGFEGDIETGIAERVVAATDNSIYQLLPRAIVYPKTGTDLTRIARAAAGQDIALCARGGGTGTNGQSLSDAVIVDCGRHLTRILDFDPTNRTVSVEPGVVLDRLNAFLRPQCLQFPIDISSSSRATLGGMLSTDASGKGSLIHGKTSAHVVELEITLADGRELTLKPLDAAALEQPQDEAAALCRELRDLIRPRRETIDRVFPRMDRHLTGYDLQHALLPDGGFDACRLIAGAEGTLALIRRIRLRLAPLPRLRRLTVVFYAEFQPALEHVQTLLDSHPLAIEMLDDKVLARAREDAVWQEVRALIGDLPDDARPQALSYIEHVGEDEAELEAASERLRRLLEDSGPAHGVLLWRQEDDPEGQRALWNLRKRAVGLLGRMSGGKRGTAFIEDSAVPPQRLAAYVREFRELLDAEGLEYGMYGHADAGVLHLRPGLDLMQAEDRARIRRLSDRVAELARRHGGVFWGEHGRGFRGEYTPLFFGDELYPLLQRIKRRFDPHNRLNPGKLVSPDPAQPLTALDGVPLRGALDAGIAPLLQQQYRDSLYCNGNGACFNPAIDQAMCPSYKASRDKRLSPKGRAMLLREWARLQSAPADEPERQALEAGLFDSLERCLSCKSCTRSCPLQVDIPEMKSRFLEHWHRQQPRPLSSLFQRHFETLLALGRRWPALANRLLRLPQTERLTGLTRLPAFSARPWNIPQWAPGKAADDAVILLRDNYLDAHDRETLLAAASLLRKLGLTVFASPPLDSGKLLHVKGWRRAFRRQAARNLDRLDALAASGLPLIACETVTRLMLDDEYPKILPGRSMPRLQSLESFVADRLAQQPVPPVTTQRPARLLPHCSEQTGARDSIAAWRRIFEALGLELEIVEAGCCGMSGLFGHETRNQQLSREIFEMGWKPALESGRETALLASGFSCRCQSREHGHAAEHPALLLDRLL